VFESGEKDVTDPESFNSTSVTVVPVPTTTAQANHHALLPTYVCILTVIGAAVGVDAGGGEGPP